MTANEKTKTRASSSSSFSFVCRFLVIMHGHKTFTQVKNVSVNKFQELNFLTIINKPVNFFWEKLFPAPLMHT